MCLLTLGVLQGRLDEHTNQENILGNVFKISKEVVL